MNKYKTRESEERDKIYKQDKTVTEGREGERKLQQRKKRQTQLFCVKKNMKFFLGNTSAE